MSENFFPKNPFPKNPRPDETSVVIGKRADEGGTAEPLRDWRELFHSFDEMDKAPEPEFLIDKFLQEQGITAIVGPPRERKSLVALNVTHSLLTGERLFGEFAVTKKPARVLYLSPESGLGSFTKRLRNMGLLPFVGKTLFCRTMNSAEHLKLDEPALLPALPGSVVILDTMVRFFEGDENSSEDMRKFGDVAMRLIRLGALSVILLHHAPKSQNGEPTLESMGRGSGDFGAFLACCWGLKLQGDDAYKSPTLVAHLKRRDFNYGNFEISASGTDDDYFFKYVPGSNCARLRVGPKKNKDGAEVAALALLRANPDMSSVKLAELAKLHDIKRSAEWFRQKKIETTGVTTN